MNLIKSKFNVIEEYDFKEIIDKYYLSHSIVSLIFKNENEIKILSKMNIQNNISIKNNSFKKISLKDERELDILIQDLKILYDDLWKEYNQINTSIKLPLLIRVENKDLVVSLNFESTLDQVDLVNSYSIDKFDNDYIYYKLIFNGTPKNFINIMSKKNYSFDIQKKIWLLKWEI